MTSNKCRRIKKYIENPQNNDEYKKPLSKLLTIHKNLMRNIKHYQIKSSTADGNFLYI